MKGLGMYDVARLIGLAGLLLLSQPTPSLAYLDPGAGSQMLQFAVGAALAGVYIFRSYWRRGIDWIRSRAARRRQP